MVLTGRRYHEWQREKEQSRAELRDDVRSRMESNPNVMRNTRRLISDLDLPGTPDLHTARVLIEAGIPDWCGTRQVRDIRIQKGDPHDGVARSDDHISRFEVDVPLSHIDHDTVSRDVCECGEERAIYTYSATHYIAGFERVYCASCDRDHHREEWG